LRNPKLKLIGIIAILLAAPEASHAQWKTKWSYGGPTGPEHWGDLDPDYAACKVGRQQSPIDIKETTKAILPVLQFQLGSRALKYLVNNGYTIRVDYHDAPGTGNFLIVGSKRYQLQQFHFHGPSEETIHGKSTEMVAHLMFQGADRKVVGVTVFLRRGRANSMIQKIWDHMPVTESKIGKDFSHPGEEVRGVQINPIRLLPADRRYYTYEGSLTAPPCTENVTWIVLKAPVEVSDAQIATFSALFPHDVRPVQPLNGRTVRESE